MTDCQECERNPEGLKRLVTFNWSLSMRIQTLKGLVCLKLILGNETVQRDLLLPMMMRFKKKRKVWGNGHLQPPTGAASD